MCLAGAQMPAYSESKEYLVKNYPDVFTPSGVPTTCVAALVGSLCGNVVSLPMDVVKSRIQNMPVPAPGQAPLYTGMVDCAKQSVAKEGVMVLWKGFTPAFVKLAPYTVLSLGFLEHITFFFTGKAAL